MVDLNMFNIDVFKTISERLDYDIVNSYVDNNPVYYEMIARDHTYNRDTYFMCSPYRLTCHIVDYGEPYTFVFNWKGFDEHGRCVFECFTKFYKYKPEMYVEPYFLFAKIKRTHFKNKLKYAMRELAGALNA